MIQKCCEDVVTAWYFLANIGVWAMALGVCCYDLKVSGFMFKA